MACGAPGANNADRFAPVNVHDREQMPLPRETKQHKSLLSV